MNLPSRLLFSCCMLLMLVSCTSCAGRQYPDQVPTMSDPAVVRLVKMVDGEEAGFCTAWKVDENHLMTAGHCCDEAEEGTVLSYTAKGPHAIPGQEITVVFDNDEHDSCLMKGKAHGPPIRLASLDPGMGEMVWTAGFPRLEYLISAGYWSGRTESGEYAKASVAVFGGASGSPVFNSKGEAVGILVAYYPPMSNMALLTPLEWARDALAHRGK